MSGLTNHAENLLLNWLLTTDSVTRPISWYVALHTTDPGETGAAGEVTTAIDSNYTRKGITFTTSTNGQSSSNVTVNWTVNSGSAGYTVTYISIWDAPTSGNCLFKGALPVPRSLAANQVLTFYTGDIIASLD